MKKIVFVAALFGACMLGACSEGDDVQGLNTDCSNLTGSFTATSATVTGTGTGGSTVDLLANNGAFTLALANGTFSTSYTQGSGGTPMVARRYQTGVRSRSARIDQRAVGSPRHSGTAAAARPG